MAQDVVVGESKANERYDGLSHAKLRLLYHVVLATKYRRRCLAGIERELADAVVASAEGMDFEVVDVGIDNGDHAHLLVRVRKADVGIGRVVRRVKSVTTKRMWDACAGELRRHYWGKGRKLWSNGYFAATVGNDVQTVSGYIQRQAK